MASSYWWATLLYGLGCLGMGAAFGYQMGRLDEKLAELGRAIEKARRLNGRD